MNNEGQIDYWNGPAGEKWVAEANRLDRMLAPFAEAVLEAAQLQSDERVMDIGCGAGALSLMAAKQVGANKGVLGVDISAPLLALATHRAHEASLPAQFERADASSYVASMPADAVISRFGVMFFADPVAAFANILANTASGGRLAFACWQALPQNDWAFAPIRAALPFLNEPPQPGEPNAPGPFAFQDKDRTAGILRQAGWQDVEIAPLEFDMALPDDDVEASAKFMLQLGPLSRLLADQGIATGPVEAALQQLLSQHQAEDGRVRMKAASWIVTGRKA